MSLQLPEERVGWPVALLARVMARHRLLFVLATVAVSIAASRVANDLKDIGSWLIVIGSACFMYLADSYQDLDEIARRLVASGMPLKVTRQDVVRARAGVRHGVALLFGTLSIAIGILLPLSAAGSPADPLRPPPQATALVTPIASTPSPAVTTPAPSTGAPSASPNR